MLPTLVSHCSSLLGIGAVLLETNLVSAIQRPLTALINEQRYRRHFLPTDSRQNAATEEIAGHFYVALDANGSGYIEHSGMKELGRRLIEIQQREQSSALALTLMAHLDAFWMQMVTSLDRDADGRISQEEFRLFFGRLAHGLEVNSGDAAEALNRLTDVLFTVCDRNASSAMSEAEFVQFARAHGSSDAVASAGFRLFDRDRKGSISLQEWQQFMQDPFKSRKLNDAAAVVFGPGSRESA